MDTLENEEQRRDVYLDLEIGDAVAVDVALDDAAGAAQLAVDAVEARRADEAEGPVAGGAVGVGR